MSQTRSALSASTYRDFIRSYLQEGKGEIPRGKIATVCRKAGLSRSFMTDLLKGRKRLTVRSLPKLIRGLQLQGPMKEFFRILVAQEEASVLEDARLDMGLSQISPKALARRMDKIRRAALREIEVKGLGARSLESSLFGFSEFLVYSALQPAHRGRPLNEIITRTGLPEKTVATILGRMVKENYVEFKSGFYLPGARTIHFPGSKAHPKFQTMMKETMTFVMDHMKELCAEEKNFFFLSAATVAEEDLPEFRERLHKSLLNLLDEFDNPESDKIKRIQLSLF